VLRWAREEGAPWGDTCSAAAMAGHLDVLQWAREEGAPWGGRTCSNAAGGGHLDVLRWARGQTEPAPWDEFTCDAAIMGGHFDTLTWARIAGCGWSEYSFELACVGGYFDIANWLHTHYCPAAEDTCALIAIHGTLAGLEHARLLGYPWGKNFYQGVAQHGSLEMLQWAHGQPQPPLISIGACIGAARAGKLDMLKWMRGLDPPFPWGPEVCLATVHCAQIQGFRCLEWLREQRPPCTWDSALSLQMLRTELAQPGSTLQNISRHPDEVEPFLANVIALAMKESEQHGLTPNSLGV